MSVDRRDMRGLISRRRLIKTLIALPVAFAVENRLASSSYPSSPASAEGLSDDPITTTLLDCSGTNAIGYSDPDSVALKRSGPDQGTKVTGYITPGVGVKLEHVIRKDHVEGNSRYWTEVVDNNPAAIDSKSSSYVLTTSADSVAEGAIRANINFNDCTQITP